MPKFYDGHLEINTVTSGNLLRQVIEKALVMTSCTVDFVNSSYKGDDSVTFIIQTDLFCFSIVSWI